jgi:DNA (cytosine-5)-methyltransferase 1
VVNGVLPTLKYYLRLLLDNKVFLKQYFKAIEEDTDLKKEHKVLTNTLINQYFSQEVN